MLEIGVEQRKAVILGEINFDLVIEHARIDRLGTVRGDTHFTSIGGRGVNQAVALSRLEVKTDLFGRVGNDHLGTFVLERLAEAGISTRNVVIDESGTGMVVLSTSPIGDYGVIAVAGGANRQIGVCDVHRFSASLRESDFALFQLAIRYPILISAAVEAKKKGAIVVLDPAPLTEPVPKEILSYVDILTPNQQETESLLGFPIEGYNSLSRAATEIHLLGVKVVIIKLGSGGVFCSSSEGEVMIPVLEVDIVDTIGAGDAFNAGLICGLINDQTLMDSLHWGTAAAAISVMERGPNANSLCLKNLHKLLDLDGNKPQKSTQA